MPLRYATGEEIIKDDRVRYHGEHGVVEIVADPDIPTTETSWFIEEYGGGVMVSELHSLGSVFTDDPGSDCLQFLGRSEKSS